MPDVFVDITMSIDGFTAGPGVDRENPMGVGGERLHEWLMGGADGPSAQADLDIAAELFEGTGAFVIGRRTFDLGIEHWGEDGTFGVPSFVVTHRPHPDVVKGPTTFHFVTDGMDAAIAEARAAAAGGNVAIMGGADVASQAIASGAVDELRLHIAPVILGGGTRLFDGDVSRTELQRTRTVETDRASHLRYRLLPAKA